MRSSTGRSTERTTVSAPRTAGRRVPAARRAPTAAPSGYSHRRPTGAVHRDRRPAGCSGVEVRVARRRRHARVLRRRLVAVVVFAGVLVVGGRTAYGALGGVPLASSERPTSTVVLDRTVVRTGDSLWSIARRLAPGRDPRPVVDSLARARHGAPLVPGEEIVWAR